MVSHFSVREVLYEGSQSRQTYAFKAYDQDRLVEGRSMSKWLRFAAAYWHTMRNGLSDPFGDGTALMPWDDGSGSVANAINRAGVFFDFLSILRIPFYCFHDRDIAPEGDTLRQTNLNLDMVVSEFKRLQEETGARLLWGTANLFSHPRYMSGAATNPEPAVFAWAAAQVKKALEVTHELGGLGYVFWGGREGYTTLLNTDMRREREHLARLLHMAVAYAKEIGFTGQLFIEPKPHEPTAFQYDSDAAACLNFLREFDLLPYFMLNIETNHATLAGRSMEHELLVAATAGKLGSIDANMGDTHLGWDTDRFPTDVFLAAQIMRVVMGMGGFKAGGLNFDAKRRRESFTPDDLILAYIAGMDTMARGLKIAAAIRKDGRLENILEQRYAGWLDTLGANIEAGLVGLPELEQFALQSGEPDLVTCQQELLEAIVNDIMFSGNF